MKLDFDFCYRAISARDPRFDGHFFVGVRTTGVYCRPVCPARDAAGRFVRLSEDGRGGGTGGFSGLPALPAGAGAGHTGGFPGGGALCGDTGARDPRGFGG